MFTVESVHKALKGNVTVILMKSDQFVISLLKRGAGGCVREMLMMIKMLIMNTQE